MASTWLPVCAPPQIAFLLVKPQELTFWEVHVARRGLNQSLESYSQVNMYYHQHTFYHRLDSFQEKKFFEKISFSYMYTLDLNCFLQSTAKHNHTKLPALTYTKKAPCKQRWRQAIIAAAGSYILSMNSPSPSHQKSSCTLPTVPQSTKR